jgi:hypothetical protein
MFRITPLLLSIAFLANAANPIRLHPANPHYFEFRGKPAILITSGEHYGAVLNLDFDYKRYLQTLAADRLNMTRVFVGAYREGPKAFSITANTLAPADDKFIAPWPRTGAKFDLKRWNNAYFTRLKNFMKEASARGIVVELTLFCPFYEDEMWNLSPLNAANNVNGVGAFTREQAYTLKDAAMQQVQDALVKKIVAELKDYDNLMYEIANEPYAHKLIPPEWERHIADVIAEAESKFPARQRHLITQNINNGSQKVPDPNPKVSVFNFHYSRPPRSVAMNWDLNRPIGNNETGFDGQADATYRVQAWEFILAGGALFNHLDYSFAPGKEDGTYAYPPNQPGGGSVALRKQYKILRDFTDSIDFIHMSPAPTLVKGAWALANQGKAYAIYLHHGTERKDRPRYFVDPTPRTTQLTLELPAANYDVDWIDTKSGKVAKQERQQHKGGTLQLASPEYTEDIALRIINRGGG